jgi:hypothetical protein
MADEFDSVTGRGGSVVIKAGMSKRDILRKLGDPAVKSSTNKMFGSFTHTAFLGRRPKNAELWFYYDFPEQGQESMINCAWNRHGEAQPGIRHG